MKLKKQQNRGRKHAKILAAMLVFLLCGCNHRDTEYKLSDSTDGSTEETVFGNQKEVDEEQTVSEKSAGETTGIPEKREAQEAAPEETVQVYICGAVASPRCLHAAGRKPRSAGCGSGRRISAGC